MAYTTIDDPSEYFHTQLYTGTGSTNAITNDANAGNFKPDWLWIKQRNTTRSHRLITSSFSSTYLQSNLSDAEASNDVVNSLDTDGFTLSSPASVNQSSGTYVAWQWKANGGTTSSNTDGSITSTVQANTTAGFSIVTYTGTGSNATVGHGLGKPLKFLIIKDRDASEGWIINSQILTGTTNGTLHFNTDAEYSGPSTQFQGTNPTSSVFYIGTAGNANTSGDNHIAYCFAEIKGYSKFGTYTGNGSADGTFVYTGFKPAYVLIKALDRTVEWTVMDNARDTFNPAAKQLSPNASDREYADAEHHAERDFLSNGFKLRGNANATNASSSNNYIYMAFAEHPFVSSKGVPATAR
jgi:hypothetical protein